MAFRRKVDNPVNIVLLKNPPYGMGITVIAALIIRIIVVKTKGEEGQSILYILGAGAIAGSAIYSFFTSTLQLGKKRS